MAGGIKIVIPGDPQAKGRPRIGVGPGGRAMAFTPKNTRHAEDVVRSIGMAAMGDRPPFDEPVTMHLLATLAVPASWPKKRRAAALDGTERPAKKPDLTNIAKLYEDALNGVVFVDDSLVVDMRLSKRYGEVASTVIWVAPSPVQKERSDAV